MLGHGACRGAKPLVGLCNLQIRNPKRVQGIVPAEGLGVSPNSLSTSPKNGGTRGLTRPRRRVALRGHVLDSCFRRNDMVRGVQRGFAPLRLFLSLKTGGSRGLKATAETGLTGAKGHQKMGLTCQVSAP